MSKPILGYWNYRGLGNPVRYLCAYLNLDYEEETYVMGGPPDHSWDPWLQEKFNLGLDFPNVPYWIEGSVKLTQVKTILKHISRTRAPELLPSAHDDDLLHAQADLIDTVIIEDIHLPLAKLCYFYSDSALESYKAEYERHWTELSNFLGSKKWILGEKLSYLDFLVYEIFYRTKAYFPALFSKFSNLDSYLTRFESIPSIKLHLESARHVKGPNFSPRAKLPGEIKF